MADPKAEKTEKAGKPAAPDENMRYRFIGFEVYPKKTKRFWKSDDEYKKHVEKARSIKTFADWDRDFSLVKIDDVTTTDRLVLTLSNVMLLITLLLPWLSYHTAAGVETATWFGVIGKIGPALGGAFEVGNLVGLSVLCGLVVFLATPVLAILGLLMLYSKGKSLEAYVRRLRLILRLNYVGLAAWILGMAFSMAGGDITPLTRSGVHYLGDSFTIATVFKVISYGAIIPLALFFLNSVKSNEL